ncbi:hypothetical protein GWK47_052353 [Chionoecetes opilio]|uniref:Myb/SANT-like DNA-binding domain-containing protein n=1 Tax=Chionoecetes opilio TaxID=41210 RepID=A0A8J5CST2_CHIOP|nr:hypothetical protein GWK47_052353 [Chionoecetes opilio]
MQEPDCVGVVSRWKAREGRTPGMEAAVHSKGTPRRRAGGSVGSAALRLIHGDEFFWGRDQVLALISSVEEHFEDFYDGTRKKKTIWNDVAENMAEKGFTCSGSDCDKKWRNLKITYIRVLKKQMHGETNNRFVYFDALHHILGQEMGPQTAGPLGLRDQALTQGLSDSVASDGAASDGAASDGVASDGVTSDGTVVAEFQELTSDDGFLWSIEVVHRLLDYILECREAFAMPDANINMVWQDIAHQLSQQGPGVSGHQCQHKWLSLEEGLRVHQGQAEATGATPLWAFYTHTLEVADTVHVRTIDQRARRSMEGTGKGSVAEQTPPRPARREGRGSSVLARVKARRSMEGTGEGSAAEQTPPRPARREGRGRSVLARVKHIESTLSVKQRLERLETRLETSQEQKESAKKTNVLLVQMLTELRRINAAFKQEETIHVGHDGTSKAPDGTCSPNQEFIIVEAYTEQL